jgi:hypothetical protein
MEDMTDGIGYTGDIGYLSLTLYKSGAPVFIKSRKVCSFYKREETYTSIYTSDSNDHFMVKETPEEIVQQIRDMHPDLR